MDHEKGKKALRFVEKLFEFLADPSDLTEAELDELLKNEGIDPDQTVCKIMKSIQRRED